MIRDEQRHPLKTRHNNVSLCIRYALVEKQTKKKKKLLGDEGDRRPLDLSGEKKRNASFDVGGCAANFCAYVQRLREILLDARVGVQLVQTAGVRRGLQYVRSVLIQFG